MKMGKKIGTLTLISPYFQKKNSYSYKLLYHEMNYL